MYSYRQTDITVAIRVMIALIIAHDSENGFCPREILVNLANCL